MTIPWYLMYKWQVSVVSGWVAHFSYDNHWFILPPIGCEHTERYHYHMYSYISPPPQSVTTTPCTGIYPHLHMATMAGPWIPDTSLKLITYLCVLRVLPVFSFIAVETPYLCIRGVVCIKMYSSIWWVIKQRETGGVMLGRRNINS